MQHVPFSLTVLILETWCFRRLKTANFTSSRRFSQTSVRQGSTWLLRFFSLCSAPSGFLFSLRWVCRFSPPGRVLKILCGCRSYAHKRTCCSLRLKLVFSAVVIRGAVLLTSSSSCWFRGHPMRPTVAPYDGASTLLSHPNWLSFYSVAGFFVEFLFELAGEILVDEDGLQELDSPAFCLLSSFLLYFHHSFFSLKPIGCLFGPFPSGVCRAGSFYLLFLFGSSDYRRSRSLSLG